MDNKTANRLGFYQMRYEPSSFENEEYSNGYESMKIKIEDYDISDLKDLRELMREVYCCGLQKGKINMQNDLKELLNV